MSPGCGSACIATFNLPSTPRLQHASTDSSESAAQTKAAYTSYSRGYIFCHFPRTLQNYNPPKNYGLSYTNLSPTKMSSTLMPWKNNSSNAAGRCVHSPPLSPGTRFLTGGGTLLDQKELLRNGIKQADSVLCAGREGYGALQRTHTLLLLAILTKRSCQGWNTVFMPSKCHGFLLISTKR